MPSKLEQMQLQFRQRLMQEKEDRMIKIHTDSQQKALKKVAKYDSTPQVAVSASIASRKPPSVSTSPLNQSPTKKSSPGVDRSRPLPPISREQAKSHQVPSRSHHSSTSSDSSTRVSGMNAARARTMDYDGGVSKTNGRLNQDAHRSHYHQQNHHDRRSPESDNWGRKHSQRPQINSKTNYDSSVKATNGHSSTVSTHNKSSTEQRTIAGNTYKVQPTPATRGKPTKTTVTASSKQPTTVSKTRSTTNAAPVRKPPGPGQEQCRYCGRNFNQDRIEKHLTICSKTATKKVKVFDATKMRVQGTEAESFVKKQTKVASISASQKPKKTNWKKQHEDFINTIRQAKVAQRHLAAGGKLSDLPPPPPSDTSDYVPCPHCGRKFSEGVAQRHIPKCKNIICNKKGPIKKK